MKHRTAFQSAPRQRAEGLHSLTRVLALIVALSAISCAQAVAPANANTVTGVCQCDMCLTIPFCASQTDEVICTQGEILNDLPCTEENCHGNTGLSSHAWKWSPAIVTASPIDGSPLTLYCWGRTTVMREQDPDHADDLALLDRPAFPVNGFTDPCLATDTLYAAWNNRRFSPPPPTDRSATCSLPSPVPATYSCNYDGLHPALNRFSCPKDLPHPMAGGVRIEFTSNTPATEGEQLLGAYCSMWSDAAYAGRVAPAALLGPDSRAPYRYAPYVCFTPVRSSRVVTDNVLLPDNSVSDPGATTGGWPTTVLSSTDVLVARGTDSTTVSATGTAEARVDPNGFFSLTELLLQQVGTATLEGHTIQNAHIEMQQMWIGDYDALRSPNIELTLPTAVVHATADIDGSTNRRDLTADSANGSFDGTNLDLNVHTTIPIDFSDPVEVTLRLHLVLSPRPTASIVSPSSTTLQCQRYADGFVGTEIAASGNVTPASASPWWSADMSDAPVINNGTSATIRVPLRTPTTATTSLAFSAISQGYLAEDRRDVQVVDTIAPTPTAGMQFDFGCGSTAPLSAILEELCDPGKFASSPAATDACDPSPLVNVSDVSIYDASAKLVQSVKCNELPYPTLSTDPELRYEVTWGASDAWGNSTPTQLTRLILDRHNPDTSCSAPTATHYKTRVTWTGPISSAPPRPAPAFGTLDWSTLAAGPTTVPSDFAFHRASVATVQTWSTSVLTNIGVDVPRIGNDGAGHHGLVLEEPRTNLIASARDLNGTGWSGGASLITTSNYGPGPDNSYLATRTQVTAANGYSRMTAVAAASGTPYTISQWVHATSGTGPYQLFVSSGTNARAVAGMADIAFRRLAATLTTAATAIYVTPVDGFDDTYYGGIAAGTRDDVTDLVQVEQGGFATEAIVTTGTAATRAADRLSATSTTGVVDSGRLSMSFRIQPKGRRQDYTGWTDLLDDGSNYISIYGPSGSLQMAVGGVVDAAGPIDWQAGDTIDLYFSVGSGTPYVAWRINDGPVVVPTISGASQPAYTTTGSFDLMSYASISSYQFTAWAQQLSAWKSGSRPYWIP